MAQEEILTLVISIALVVLLVLAAGTLFTVWQFMRKLKRLVDQAEQITGRINEVTEDMRRRIEFGFSIPSIIFGAYKKTRERRQ